MMEMLGLLWEDGLPSLLAQMVQIETLIMTCSGMSFTLPLTLYWLLWLF